VVAVAIGQILFKKSAIVINELGGFLNIKFLTFISIAAILYIASTLLWIWLLRRVDLGKTYPYFALCFLIVPLVSNVVFHEPLGPRYWVGVLLISGGVVLATYR